MQSYCTEAFSSLHSVPIRRYLEGGCGGLQLMDHIYKNNVTPPAMNHTDYYSRKVWYSMLVQGVVLSLQRHPHWLARKSAQCQSPSLSPRPPDLFGVNMFTNHLSVVSHFKPLSSLFASSTPRNTMDPHFSRPNGTETKLDTWNCLMWNPMHILIHVHILSAAITSM